MGKIMVLYGSSRRNGNTDLLADRATGDLEVTKVYLQDWNIQPITDQRHEGHGFSPVEDDYETLLTTFLDHDVYVFATPLYWFGMPAPLKAFFDRWSQYKNQPAWAFKERLEGKKVYVITAANDEPVEKVSAPLLQQFDLICRYIGLHYEGAVIGQGSRPKEVLQDSRALYEIEKLKQTLQYLTSHK